MTPVYDMTDADESAASYEPIPKGKYLFEITDCEERETSEEAAKYPEVPMIWFEFTCLDESYEGRKAWNNIVIPDGDDAKSADARKKGLGRLKATLRATGVFSDKKLDSNKFKFDPEDVIGAKVTLDLRVNKKTENNNVYKVLPAAVAEAGEDGEPDEDELP